jgi:hypothetical protein
MTATDRTFRAMARAEPDTLLALLRVIAPQHVPLDATVAPFDVLTSWTDLPPPTDADWVAKIARWRRIVHVECQGYRDTTFLRRVVHYHAGLALRFPKWRVTTFALWLLRPPRRQRTDVITVGALSVKVTSVVLREIPVATLLTSPVTACFAPVGDPGALSPAEVCAPCRRTLGMRPTVALSRFRPSFGVEPPRRRGRRGSKERGTVSGATTPFLRALRALCASAVFSRLHPYGVRAGRNLTRADACGR